jgi:hypothetical protein
MRFSFFPVLVAAALASGSAGAVSLTVLPSGTFVPPSWLGAVATFDSITPTPYGDTTATGDFSDGGVVMDNYGAGSLGLYVTPFGDATNYMAVLGGRSETIAYGSAKDAFGLYWGSVDSYNLLTFSYEGAVVATISGAQTGPLLASGGQGDYSSNGYVVITGLPKFDTVVMTSSSNSFEFDNVAAGAVPEASTWSMMGLGFAGLGWAAFNSRSKKRIARALA